MSSRHDTAKSDAGTSLVSSSRDPKPRDASTDKGKAGGKGATGKIHSKDRDMGAALRSVYQNAVEESIPDDLLDLLGKLH